MQRACKLIMLVLIVYSGCENEIDLQTLILWYYDIIYYYGFIKLDNIEGISI